MLRVRMRVPADTLKEKRTVVKSVVARVRNRFNAAAAEVDDLDSPGYATIGVTCVSNDAAHADSMLQSIARFIETERLDVEVLTVETETLRA